jgi:hypothetical protein
VAARSMRAISSRRSISVFNMGFGAGISSSLPA